MIHFFNRAELRRTFDADELARMRNALEIHQIPYRIKIRSERSIHNGSWNGRGGIFPGANPVLGTMYTIFVKRCDFERAMHCISKI